MNFSQDVTSYFPEEESFISHNERHYVKEKAKDISSSHFCSLPVLFQDPTGVNILFTEADLYDYPCMFLFGSGQNTLKAGFPKQVLDITVPEGADRSEIISKEADCIATVAGTRNFPWRLFYITEKLGDMIENDLVYQLSRPLVLDNTKWIKPGKVSWDWWNANNIYGVDFKAGINTDTYKYYIDFASKFGLQYIILDEGWSKTTTNVLESNSDINIEELVGYGKEKGVGVILWMLWKPLDKDMGNILDQFSKWGVKGIKVDFMQRSDQYMVNYYERVAKEAAKRHLLVDFHGAFKPSGLHRAYPNVLSYEGVKGMENDKWSKEVTPEHDVTLPFTRMVAGPMDFTPGAMLNAQPKDFYPCFDRPMSMGTRCHQIAMYMVYESPLQMMADSPSNYYKESESAEFISRIPTTWDETKVLDAKVGEYIVIARKNGNKWYIGAMTNETEREFQIDLSFLSKGEHQAEIMQDGVNAYKNAVDYKKVKTTFNSKDKVKINLAPGGGWAAIVSE
jgi:alpha-glucosidase